MRTGLDLDLIPDTVELLLWQQLTGDRAQRMLAHWHRSVASTGMLVTLASRGTTSRNVRLSVRGETPVWRAEWVRWRPHIDRGEALQADGPELVLTLGERAAVMLEFDVALDGETYADNYGFVVIGTDLDSGEEVSIRGTLRLRHPDARLLAYLPALYTPDTMLAQTKPAYDPPYEDPPLFVRFLRGFEDALLPIQEMLGEIEVAFDPAIAPPDFLPWLASWVALALDANWPELQRRRLIREAVDLYRWRGTRRGLTRYLEIYTGYEPEITDRPFVGMRLGDTTLMGRNALLGDTPPHTFVVTFSVPEPAAVNEHIVRSIIEAEKPAHTAYFLRIIESGNR